jgi:hypothetical protein
VRILVKSASHALELKDELSRAGLIIHVDYTWCYHPLIDFWPEQSQAPWVEFNFVDSALETYYQLKWSSYE